MKTRFLLLFISLNFIFATSLFADVVYVNAAATPGGDGSSWNTAFTNLYDAIDAAQSGDEIWLAGGEYNTFVRPGDTENSPYIIDKSLSIHGGFVAGQTSLQERDTTMPRTVLTSFEGET